jgi:hypothetical protein
MFVKWLTERKAAFIRKILNDKVLTIKKFIELLIDFLMAQVYLPGLEGVE